MERRTPFYEQHMRLGAQMVKGGGDYMFPLVYTTNADEHVNTRTNVGVQDLSTMGEVDVKGPGAERLINSLTVNDMRSLEVGQMRYSTIVNEQGGIVDDITVYKFGDEHFMVVTSSGPRKKTYQWIRDHAQGTSAYVTDITASVALPVVQGPRSRELLKSICQECDLDQLRYFRFTRARIGETELIISRSGYTGELGFELYMPAEEAGALWDYLLQVGRSHSLKPYGVLTMHSLRIEKCYPLYGPDMSEQVTPFHVGLERWIKFDHHDFVGREALIRVAERGPEQRWVGLILQEERAANPKDKVFAGGEWIDRKDKATGVKERVPTGGEEVGYVTASSKSWTLDNMLAMAYVRT
ncbi:MAG: aminomethyltransferase family protein, partial [Chloroflexi bacterium]|nr:aminomethyltransferase family protein [Chloroflexota bacterium]